MSKSISLADLNKRMAQLEGGSSSPSVITSSISQPTVETLPPSPFLIKVIQKKQDKEQKVMEQVETEANKQLLVNNVDVKNIFKVIEFVVEFVEGIVKYVPDIIGIVGGVLTGDLKLGLAVDLISKIYGSVVNVLDHLAIQDIVNHTVHIKYNQTTKEVEAEKKTLIVPNPTLIVKEQVPDNVKGKKRGCFGSRFASKGK